MRTVALCILLLSSLSSSHAARYCNGDSCEEEQGLRLLGNFNVGAEELCREGTLAGWNMYVDMNAENQAAVSENQERTANFTVEFVNEALQCNWKSFSDPQIRRQFELLTKQPIQQLPPEENAMKENITFEMQRIFGTAAVCPYGSNSADKENCTMSLDNGIQSVLDTSTNFDELLYYWKAWRDETGRKMRNLYADYIPLANKEAAINGYSDLGDAWRANYEDENLVNRLEELWDKVAPLYKQLHAYVRRKLIGVYGEDKICADGPIPAHLIGSMMGESWVNLENITRPYPNKPIVDITPVMKERNMTMMDMAKISEDFYQSLGLPPMTPAFWNYSIFERIPGREMICHPGALDLCDGKDFRIIMCGKVNMYDLKVIHHEMGHIQYFMLYSHQPPLFREGANEGFHEAVGDAIALSVFHPTHWRRIGFMENETDDEEQDMNALFSTAMDKLAVLPHTYMVDKWRWDVFSGTVDRDNMNRKWWEYRLKYQGNCPSVKRTEKDLDPASLYHVPAGVSYTRYYVAFILQFQFHKALCDAAGYVGPLDKCDIYGSKEAGERLKAMLSLGMSRPWPEALKALTNGEVDDLDVTPMLEYFEPLKKWLEKENKNEYIGWKSDDPTICP